MNRDIIIFASIYLITFGIIAGYNLTHPIVNDGVYEYNIYMLNIKEGWQFRGESIVNSCLITTWLPALIYKNTWIGHEIFHIFPAFFYALMPAFTYLIARKYTIARYAVVAGLVVMFSSFILFFPSIGRVGVALGFMAGMIWALLNKKLGWAVAFSILVVFSHYVTCLIALGIVGVVLLFTLIKARQLLRQYLLIFIILLLLIVVWHFFIAVASGRYLSLAVSGELPVPKHTGETLMGLEDLPFFTLETREIVVQEAFGFTFADMSIPERIELVFNWLVVGMLSLGLLLMLRNKEIDLQFKTMLVSLYALILVTIAFPWMSLSYGAQRTYFTASIVLAVCFPFTVNWLSKRVRIPSTIISGCVLLPYALCTSGLLYNLFQLEKTFPIYMMIEGG